MPPGCSVWRANLRGGWHFHVRPHRRGSAAWSKFGGNSFLALKDCIKQACTLYLNDHCLPESHCPVPGVFG
eukprot:2668490-Pyramimonas_sp.AAC.1